MLSNKCRKVRRRFSVADVVRNLNLGMPLESKVKDRLVRNVCLAIRDTIAELQDRDVLYLTNLGRFRCSDLYCKTSVVPNMEKKGAQKRRIYFKRTKKHEHTRRQEDLEVDIRTNGDSY